MRKSIQTFFAFSALAIGSLLSACQSMIFDDQGDCSVHYLVPIKYTNNSQNTNAFASWIKSVTLYVYDTQGTLVLKKTESGDALLAPDYAMEVDVKPGRYNLLAWCEGAPSHSPSASYEISGNQESLSSMTAAIHLQGSDDNRYIDKDIVPLYHSYSPNVEFTDTYGNIIIPAMDLTKDTNMINVAVENLDGSEIDEDAITVSIEADNNVLNWENQVVGSTPFEYKPWGITAISSDRQEASVSGSVDVTPITGIFTEMTVGRLMVDRKPILVVHRKSDDKDIIRIDLINYLLLVKGSYPFNWTDQQYLDCIDRFSLTFFVDAGINWYTAAGININGWKVVPPQDTEL